MMSKKSLLALLVVSLFITSAIPAATAFKGYQLSRPPVEDFSLIDQNNQNVNLTDSRGDVVVVAFVFTRCPDVCPVITQLLRSVESGIGADYEEHVSIISISVDPEFDTPERLKEYTELHKVNWSHLTGDLADMESIYANFGLVVQKNVIEAHIGDINGHQAEDSTVMLVNNTGVATELMNTPSAWSTTKFAAFEAGWELNSSTHPIYGTSVSGIDGIEAPSDNSWYWKLMTYNTSGQAWEGSMLGADSVTTPTSKNIAWMASTADATLLTTPDLDNSSVSLIYPDNTTAFQQINNSNGWHLTSAAFDGAGIEFSAPHSQYGHYLESVGQEDPAADNDSWRWELHEWNETSMGWQSSAVGMDSIESPSYLAWAPNSTADSDIPIPGAFVEDDQQECDGNGWEMGSGASKHCMCDSGYEWPEDTMLSCVQADIVEEYNVGHSTTTFILDTERKPVVAWTGDNWNAEEFISDVRAVVENDGLVDTDSDSIPGFTTIASIAAISLAAVRIGRKQTNESQ